MLRRLRAAPLLAPALVVSAAVALALAPVAAAHTGHEVGEYILEIGWLQEPAFVGQPNAVQVTITNHHDGKPVTDLAPGALAVVVSTAGQDSPSLPLDPAFDAAEGEGPLGEYRAAVVPTAPGDYTFHITGKIHEQVVDLSVTSGEETFDPVMGASDAEFPVKLPTLAEVTTRLDRIDSRIESLQSAPASAGQDAAIAAANAKAADAADRATVALSVGIAVGVAGLIVAIVALVVAMRSSRRGSGTA